MHDTITLREVCLKDPYISRYFTDVYPADLIPKDLDGQGREGRGGGCLIANTDPYGKSGQHWIALWWDGDRREFFDSYGERPSDLFWAWRRFMDWERKDRPLQRDDTDVCGDYCLYYLYRRSRGSSFHDIIKAFSPVDLDYNDQAVMQRMHDLFPRRLSDQSHEHVPRQYCILRRDVKIGR